MSKIAIVKAVSSQFLRLTRLAEKYEENDFGQNGVQHFGIMVNKRYLEKRSSGMKNEQSRDTDNILYTRQSTKTKIAKNTTQKTKKMNNTDITKNRR